MNVFLFCFFQVELPHLRGCFFGTFTLTVLLSKVDRLHNFVQQTEAVEALDMTVSEFSDRQCSFRLIDKGFIYINKLR